MSTNYRKSSLSVGISGFASMLPEIIEIMGNQPKYNGAYKVYINRYIQQKTFIKIVCGKYLFIIQELTGFHPPPVVGKISSFV